MLAHKRFVINLKYLRSKNGYTQQYIADQLGINRTTYTKWEIGEAEPSFNKLEKLATLFEVDFNSFFMEIKSEDGLLTNKNVNDTI